ncbi:MAG: alanine racemase [Gammaproteobacteria bacterium]|nr:alanine racemase [Gammaproteobacteria bacterium]
MKTNYRQTTATIDLSAYKNNIELVKKFASSSKIMAVIKSNAYGHGMLATAQFIKNDVEAFAVSSIDEAIFLRENKLHNQIVILEGFQEIDEISIIIEYGLIPVIHHQYQLDLFKKHIQSKSIQSPISIWIKLDTGMNRLGFKSNELELLANDLTILCESVNIIGFMSHYACADEPEHDLNGSQQVNFTNMLNTLLLNLNGQTNISNQYELDNYQLSFSNSAAILSLPEAHFHWVRPGVVLYGINPLSQRDESINQSLKAVMQFTSRVIAIKKLQKGDTVGYGASYKANQDKVIAIISVGYGDGYPRHAGTGTPMMINGHRVELVGRVSMDMICCDISHLSSGSVNIGDRVELWGHSISVSEIADHAGTIAYELVCGITSRVQYIYQD